MLKGRGMKDGNPMLLLGLTGENLTRLVAGEPILVKAADMAAMGLPAIDVALTYGKTDEAILKEIKANGGAVRVHDATELPSHRQDGPGGRRPLQCPAIGTMARWRILHRKW